MCKLEYFANGSVIQSAKPGTMFLPKESNKKAIDAVFIDDAKLNWLGYTNNNKQAPSSN